MHILLWIILYYVIHVGIRVNNIVTTMKKKIPILSSDCLFISQRITIVLWLLVESICYGKLRVKSKINKNMFLFYFIIIHINNDLYNICLLYRKVLYDLSFIYFIFKYITFQNAKLGNARLARKKPTIGLDSHKGLATKARRGQSPYFIVNIIVWYVVLWMK